MATNLTFEFGKYTEITDYAKNRNKDYNTYLRFFICPDVYDTWLVRIQEGINSEYEKEEGCFLLERDKIDNDFKGQKLDIKRLNQIIDNDSFENWDSEQGYDLEEMISEYIDSGYGINNLKTN